MITQSDVIRPVAALNSEGKQALQTSRPVLIFH